MEHTGGESRALDIALPLTRPKRSNIGGLVKKLRIGVKGHEVEGSYIIDGRFLVVTSGLGTARVVLGLSHPDKLARALVKSMVERSSGARLPMPSTKKPPGGGVPSGASQPGDEVTHRASPIIA